MIWILVKGSVVLIKDVNDIFNLCLCMMVMVINVDVELIGVRFLFRFVLKIIDYYNLELLGMFELERMFVNIVVSGMLLVILLNFVLFMSRIEVLIGLVIVVLFLGGFVVMFGRIVCKFLLIVLSIFVCFIM